MDSRQQFEEWYLQKFYEGNRAAGICWLVREDCGRYTYAMPAEHWRTWQASRESLVVTLPEIEKSQAWMSDYDDGCVYGRNCARNTIEYRLKAQGIRTK